MESLDVSTARQTEFVDITGSVQSAVARCGAQSGICLVYVPHTTAAVTVNESYDPDVAGDIENTLDQLVPRGRNYGGRTYAHGEGNADAHIKASIIGSSVQIPVEDGRLALGRWQGVLFCEFDGPRQRQVRVKVIGDTD